MLADILLIPIIPFKSHPECLWVSYLSHAMRVGFLVLTVNDFFTQFGLFWSSKLILTYGLHFRLTWTQLMDSILIKKKKKNSWIVLMD